MLNPLSFRLTGSVDTSRNHSPDLWYDAPILEVLAGTRGGIHRKYEFDDIGFTVPTTEGQIGPYWKAFSSTGGTIKPAAPVRGGVITLGSNDDDEGASIATCSPPFQIINTDGGLWYESRWKVTSTAVTRMDAFVGLGELMTLTATVPITATAGTMADQNMIGFLRPGTSTTGDGSSIRFFYKANGVAAVTIQTAAAAITADTFIKTGFKYDPVTNLITWYINNVKQTATYTLASAAGTDFPNDVLLGPIAASLNTVGSQTDLFTIDWIEVLQLDAPGA